MTITKANAKENLGNLFDVPLRKRKLSKISRFSFVIISVRMVQSQKTADVWKKDVWDFQAISQTFLEL